MKSWQKSITLISMFATARKRIWIAILILLSSLRVQSQTIDLLNRSINIVGRQNKITGPNCWNYSLYTVGLNMSLRNVEPKEITTYLNSPFCQKIKTSDPFKPGQLGAIRKFDKNGDLLEEIHAFTFLDKNIVLTKNGPGTNSYKKMFFKNMLDLPDYSLKNKGYVLERYNCQSLNSFLIKNEILPELRQLIAVVQKFSEMYERVTFFSTNLDMDLTEDTIDETKKLIEQIGLKQKMTVTDKWVASSLVLEINGLAGQIYYSHASPIMNYFENLTSLLSKIIQNN